MNEEILKILNELISWKGKNVEIRDYEIEAIERLLNLYQAEKEKRNQLFEEYNKRVQRIIDLEMEIKEILDRYDFTNHNGCLAIPVKVLEKLLEEE